MATDADVAHLEVRGIGKSFGATRALDDVSVTVRAGSVHAFVGENGAGKSTLGKIIAGVFPQDQGDLVLRGTTVSFASPRQALVRGIALVAQEVALVPRLTVAENVFLGAEPRRAGFIDRRSLRDRFERLTRESGFDLDATTMVSHLPLAQQQQVEILRALARDADLIVLDEPSASLSAKEIDRLHEVVRGLRAAGRTVILVSHFLTRGPRPLGCRHRPPGWARHQDQPDGRRDGEQPRHRDARPARRPRLPRQAAAASGRTRRPVHRRPVRARRRGRDADAAGGGDRRDWPGSSAQDGRSWRARSSGRAPRPPVASRWRTPCSRDGRPRRSRRASR